MTKASLKLLQMSAGRIRISRRRGSSSGGSQDKQWRRERDERSSFCRSEALWFMYSYVQMCDVQRLVDPRQLLHDLNNLVHRSLALHPAAVIDLRHTHRSMWRPAQITQAHCRTSEAFAAGEGVVLLKQPCLNDLLNEKQHSLVNMYL